MKKPASDDQVKTSGEATQAESRSDQAPFPSLVPAEGTSILGKHDGVMDDDLLDILEGRVQDD